MNKPLYIIRNILILIFLGLFITSCYNFDLFKELNIDLFIVSLLLIINIGVNIKDLIKKDKINYNNIFNVLTIIVFLTMIFVYLRGYSNNFIYNSKENMDILSKVLTSSEYSNLSYFNRAYLNQNNIYFIILLLSILIYRRINKDANENYNIISLICFYFSLITLYMTIKILFLNTLNIGFVSFAFIFNTLLVIIEITRLIKDLHKKKIWINILSFIVNILTYIAIFMNIHVLFIYFTH